MCKLYRNVSLKSGGSEHISELPNTKWLLQKVQFPIFQTRNTNRTSKITVTVAAYLLTIWLANAKYWSGMFDWIGSTFSHNFKQIAELSLWHFMQIVSLGKRLKNKKNISKCLQKFVPSKQGIKQIKHSSPYGPWVFLLAYQWECMDPVITNQIK